MFQKATTHKDLLTVKEAAEALTLKPKTIWGWISARKIAVHHIGSHTVRIPYSEVERVLSAGFIPAVAR